MKKTFYILFALGLFNGVGAQNNKGIHFQGIARSESGMIIAKKQISLKISILSSSDFILIVYFYYFLYIRI